MGNIVNITRRKEQWAEIINTMPIEGPGIRGADYFISAQKDWHTYKRFFNFGFNSTVLDVGCGQGRMASNFINSNINYLGIDILPEMLVWAANAYAPWKNIKFLHTPLKNGMYSNEGIEAINFRSLQDTKSINGILALSLFTHLETLGVVERYLMEFRRVIRDDGTLVVTFFVSPPNACCNDANRSVFSLIDIYYLFTKLRFNIHTIWGGLTSAWHDQRVFILKPY